MSLSRDRFRLPVLGVATAALTTAGLFAPTTVQAAPVTAAPATVSISTAAVTSTTSTTAVPSAAVRVALLRKSVIRTAASLKGRPYRYGATGPSAFDCSGYTRYVFARNGIKLPRTSRAQYTKARRISKASARPGDLVFFGRGSAVYHVGIYAGNGRIWHSPRPGKTVRLVKIWTSSWSAGRVV